jgi:zeta-carotene desaturase
MFQVYDKARNAVALALSPVVRALVDPDGALQQVRDLDDVSFSDWFLSKGGTRESITRMWDPVAYALGFIDCDNISARCMLTIFTLFATKTEASLLRMLKGSPDVYLSGPIKKYITDRGGRYDGKDRNLFCISMYCTVESLHHLTNPSGFT